MKVVDPNGETDMDEDQWEAASTYQFYQFIYIISTYAEFNRYLRCICAGKEVVLRSTLQLHSLTFDHRVLCSSVRISVYRSILLIWIASRTYTKSFDHVANRPFIHIIISFVFNWYSVFPSLFYRFYIFDFALMSTVNHLNFEIISFSACLSCESSHFN
jgi:hypothetical protein